MTEGAPRQPNKDKKTITSPEKKERYQAFAEEFQERLQKGALDVLSENRKEALKRFGIESSESISNSVHSGVIIMNKRGEEVGKAGRTMDVDRRINGASSTKVVNSLFMLISLSEQGLVDLNDIDRKQLPKSIKERIGNDGSKEEYIEENEISVREYLERIFGYSDNPQLSALRKMYVSHFKAEPNVELNPMDVLQNRINQELNTTSNNKKYISRGTLDARIMPPFGNTAPLKTILESFRYSVRLCKDKESKLPKEFRKVFLSSLKILPEEVVDITKGTKSLRLLHTFKRQNPDKEIREKSGWYADQGDDMNTINSFSEVKIEGKTYYVGWYVEAPELITKKMVDETSDNDKDQGEILGEYRILHQWRFMKNAGEVIKKISKLKEFKLFT